MTGTGTSVWVLGGHQSDFARNLSREGSDFSDLFEELVRETLPEAAVPARDVEVIHVGNAFGQLFTGQGHLGAMPATVEPALWGVPAARHEAACASGSIAVLAARRPWGRTLRLRTGAGRRTGEDSPQRRGRSTPRRRSVGWA